MPNEPLTFDQLPDDVVEFISDIEAVRFAKKFVEDYGIDGKHIEVMNLVEDVVLGEVEMSSLPFSLEEFGVAKDKSKQAAVDIASKRLLPIAGVVGDVAGQMNEWGGSEGEKGEVIVPQVSAEEFVNSFLAKEDELYDDPVKQKRIRSILTSYVKGVRDSNGVLVVLQRPLKVGGLELEEQDAKSILAEIDHKLSYTKILSEPMEKVGEVEDMLKEEEKLKVEKISEEIKKVVETEPVEQAKPVKKVPKITVQPTQTKPDVFSEDDKKEVDEIALKTKEIRETAKDPTSTLSPVVQKVLLDSQVKIEDDVRRSRFEKIVELRLRGVRGAFDTRAQIESPLEKGGLGIRGRQLSDLVGALEKAVDDNKKELAEKVENEKERRKEEKRGEERKREGVGQKEEDILSKRYASLTGKVPTQTVSPVAPKAARVSVTIPAEEHLKSQEKKIDTDKVRRAIEQSKQVNKVSKKAQFSEGSIPREKTARPKVEDVRHVSALAGPTEELRRMNIVDFRRLSKDPVQAITKIKDKIDLLEDQGFEKKVQGIQAWRESAINKQYLELAREALMTSSSLEDILAKKRGVGEDVPSNEELSAIVKLNAELRF